MEKKERLNYAVADLGFLLTFSFVGAFLDIYWVYVIGLDAFLVGTSSAIAGLTFALASPIVGSLSDKKKYNDRLGKRRVFLLYGIIPFSIIPYFIFKSPQLANHFGESNGALAVYLFLLTLVFNISYAIMRTPYISLLPEITDDREEQVSISALMGLFRVIGMALSMLLPMVLAASLEEPENIYNNSSDQDYMQTILPRIALLFGIFAIITIVNTFFSINEPKPLDNENIEEFDIQKTNIKQIFKDIINCFKDHNFLIMNIAILLVSLTLRILLTLLFPLGSYVAGLENSKFIIFALGVIPFVGAGFVYWKKSAKKDLGKTFLRAISLATLGLFASALLFIPMSSTFKIILAYIGVSFILFCITSILFIHMPIVAKCVEEENARIKNSSSSENDPEQNQFCEDKNVSGLYFGTFSLMQNLALALGNFIKGTFLAGNRAKDPFYLTLILPFLGIFCLTAVLVFRKYND